MDAFGFKLALFKPKSKTTAEIATGCGSFNYEEVGLTRGKTMLTPDHHPSFQGGKYVIDHYQCCLGRGKQCYDRAVQGLQTWKQFQLGWAEVDERTPVCKGQRLTVNAHPIPVPKLLWIINPLEIVYTDGRNQAFEEGTRVSHGELRLPTRREMHGEGRRGLRFWRRSKHKASPDHGARDVVEFAEAQRMFAFAHGTLDGHMLAGEERFQVEWKNDDTVWYDISVFSKAGHPVAQVAYPFVRYLQRRFARDSMDSFSEYCNRGET
mmetsp:Transcript_10570/g.38847  ORF Transcript_10570/g.38847 Transcript_10570/m.38847 type:complete len:265 (+) Transcript_10570:82-876(+)